MFCPVCGAQIPEGARFCATCGTPISENPAAPAIAPQAPIRPVTTLPTEDNLARLGDRFLALVLDSLLILAVFTAAGMAAARRFGGITEQGFSFEGMPAVLSVGATLIVGFLYYWLSEGLFGATLGKGMIGLRVQLKDGGSCGLRPSLIRNLLRLIDAVAVYLVGFLIAILSKHRQRLGDHVAGTIVVEAKAGTLARSSLVILWVLVLGGGVIGAFLVHRGAPVVAVQTGGGRTAPEPPPGQSAALVLPSMTFSSTGALRVKNFEFLQSEGGPSHASASYTATDKVHVKYDIEGYSTDSDGRPRLLYEVSAHDPAGLLLHNPWKDSFTRPLEAGNPVHGTFSLGLPRAVPSGLCNVTIKVRDELNNGELTLTAPFQVDAPALAPASNLEIRDFELALSESGPAVQTIELSGGGVLYMRCKVFGMRFNGDQAEVRMAVRLTGPGGRVVFEKPDYGSIRDSWVYHPATFHVPVSGNLSLPGNSEKGSYKVAFNFTDAISGQTVVAEGRIEVR